MHGRHRSSITRNKIVLWKKNVIWSDFKSNHKISNQITCFPNQIIMCDSIMI